MPGGADLGRTLFEFEGLQVVGRVFLESVRIQGRMGRVQALSQFGDQCPVKQVLELRVGGLFGVWHGRILG